MCTRELKKNHTLPKSYNLSFFPSYFLDEAMYEYLWGLIFKWRQLEIIGGLFGE